MCHGRHAIDDLRGTSWDKLWTATTKIEICQRLHIAQKRTPDAYKNVIKGYDLHRGSQIAQLWPFITAAFGGIARVDDGVAFLNLDLLELRAITPADPG